AVPIETRYAGTSPGTFRKSHFRLVRDLWHITSHVVKQVWAYGHVWREYRRVRANPVIVDDADGEFATVPAIIRSNQSP
ncbi:glycosyltransferase family 2 protein, partial [Xanthomonas oryzae pv. oryzae]